jgi:type I restriction enzyme S subunit
MSSVVLEPPQEPLYLNSFCFCLRPADPSLLTPGYSKYIFRSARVRQEIAKTASGVTRFNISKHVARAKVKRLSAQGLAKITIPVPPLEEQARIVAILDKFDALVNDLSRGLPAELAARRKQYDHYRDRLLTFEDAAA